MYCINEECKNFAVFENRDVVKMGHSKRSGAQKYLCRSCRTGFAEFHKIVKDYTDKDAVCLVCGRHYVVKHHKAKYCDNCQKIKKREWDRNGYQKNREKRIKYVKEYTEKNREAVLQRQREYYLNNKERLSEYGKKAYRDLIATEEGHEKVLNWSRRYRSENRDKCYQAHKKYAEFNPDKVKESAKNYNKRIIDTLDERYIIKQLAKVGHINPTKELIESSRARLTIKRELKKWREIENDAIQRDDREQPAQNELAYEEGHKP